jgi:hypothetical protein
MSYAEIITSVIALLALVISLVVWHGQRRLQREANDLQRATAELSRRQLESLEKQEQESKVARLQLAIEPRGNGHVLSVRNFGPAIAYDVVLTPHISIGQPSPFVHGELESKFPAAKLLPTTSIGVMANFYLDSERTLNVTVKWRDGTGLNEENTTLVT